MQIMAIFEMENMTLHRLCQRIDYRIQLIFNFNISGLMVVLKTDGDRYATTLSRTSLYSLMSSQVTRNEWKTLARGWQPIPKCLGVCHLLLLHKKKLPIKGSDFRNLHKNQTSQTFAYPWKKEKEKRNVLFVCLSVYLGAKPNKVVNLRYVCKTNVTNL